MLDVILAGLIVAAVGLPIVTIFDKWKKEMETEQTNEEEGK